MKLSDVRNYLLEKCIEIRITPKYVNVINYKDIGHFDNKNIIIYYDDGNIKISGDNMNISKLMNNEILIIGSINNVELR